MNDYSQVCLLKKNKQRLIYEILILKEELASDKRIINSLADRVAAQSEIIQGFAERRKRNGCPGT